MPYGDDNDFLTDPIKERIEAKIRQGDYASTSDYVHDLVRRDRKRRAHPESTIGDLGRVVDNSRASGINRRSGSDILAEAKEITSARGTSCG